MSSLNNFMKNNKGYYQWIHSLKAASVEAHFKGRAMLEESLQSGLGKGKPVGVNPADLEKAHQELMTSTDGPGRPPKGPHIDPKFAGDVKKTSAQIYAEILAAKKAKDSMPTQVDMTGDGKVDAQDVAADAKDNNIEDEDNPIDPNLMRPPTKLARQARAEAGYETEEDKETAHREEQEAEYYARQEDEQEGIEGIVDRMMRGKR
jgi:hypothetical protein